MAGIAPDSECFDVLVALPQVAPVLQTVNPQMEDALSSLKVGMIATYLDSLAIVVRFKRKVGCTFYVLSFLFILRDLLERITIDFQAEKHL